MEWTKCSDAFRTDGSLRDIYVHGTTVQDWNRFLSFLAASSYAMEYTRDGEAGSLPADAAEVFADRESAHNLAIRVVGLTLNCHFFTSEEIEVDIDTREVTSQEHLDAIVRFISGVGAELHREVVLTEESAPDYVWFRYSVDGEQVSFIEHR